MTSSELNLEWNKKSICDTENRVFEYNGVFHRGIFRSNSEVLELMKTDFYKELCEKDLLPQTRESNLKIEGFDVVLEHETAPVITYSHEWSFDMLKDAALLYLEICKIAKRHGYSVKDGHASNIVFFGNKPKFVDIGSFYKAEYLEFKQFTATIILPLLIWSRNYYRTAFNLLNDENKWTPYNEIICTYQGLLFFAQGKKKGIFNYRNFLKNEKKRIYSKILEDKIALVEGLKSPNYSTMWHSYHNQYDKTKKVEPTPRFKRIIDMINGLDGVESLYDVACNQGYFSFLVADNCPQIKKISGTDFDENAINEFYLAMKRSGHGKRITAGVSNLVSMTSNFQEKPANTRFRSDCVVVLALTHHLLLGQGYHFDVVLNRLYDFTNKYLLIEFMPHGLWNGVDENAMPGVPDYYTEAWYEQSISKYFNVINKEVLEKNRVMFVCIKK